MPQTTMQDSLERFIEKWWELTFLCLIYHIPFHFNFQFHIFSIILLGLLQLHFLWTWPGPRISLLMTLGIQKLETEFMLHITMVWSYVGVLTQVHQINFRLASTLIPKAVNGMKYLMCYSLQNCHFYVDRKVRRQKFQEVLYHLIR